MGIQSFQFPIDFLNNLERPIIYIARKDKTIVGSVSIYDELSLTFNLNAFQTASFKIYKNIDGKEQDYFEYFEDGMLIMIPGLSWYVIHVETNIENNGIAKFVTAKSLECTLCYKRLIDFECNAGEILYDDYVKTVFYDPTNPNGSLLHRVLNVTPNWSVGHVDISLQNKQRSFDQSDIDVYSFLTGEVSEAFNCLFTFDTFNCTVNAYDLDNYGHDTNIFVSMDNLADDMSETIDENSIFTCYRVNGGDGVYINEVNPNGTNKIYNFEYYLPMMPEDLRNKINNYNITYQNLKPQYEDIISRMQGQIDIIQELYTRLPESLSSKDWTKYGLSFLQSKKKSFETQDQIYVAQGMNKIGSLSYNLYLQNKQDLDNVTAELNVRQREVDAANNQYNFIKLERDQLQSQLDMDKWFTKNEWKTLDSYVIEETYTNDNYIVTDLEDDSDRFDIENQLFHAAWKDLEKKCRPQYQYSSTLTNILTIPEFRDLVPYFELGNFIQVETYYDAIIKMRIISFTIDFNSTQKINVTFSDAIRVKDIYEDAANIQDQANSLAFSFKFNKDQYDKTVKQGNWVAEMRKYGLDVATTAIHNTSNQNQTWDETGMTFRQWNDERQDYDPEMIRIINNMMVFSDDGLNTVRMGIGKIAVGNNEYAYGLNAELVIGKLFLGQYLTIENDSGTYKIDDNGFTASNGINTIKIQPNTSNELFSIYKNDHKQFHIDSSGNIHFEGDLTGATGTFSGLLSGGSINIGNGIFIVDKNGNMYASSGTFSGNIASSVISGSSIKGATISGGSINIGNGAFTVDQNGLVEVGGDITADTSLYLSFQLFSDSNKIKVDSLNVSLGEYQEYSAYGNRPKGILSANGIGTRLVPILNLGNGASIIKTSKQFQPNSIYSATGLFEELVVTHANIANLWLMSSTDGTYGGTVYECNGSYGNEGIASPGWVKNYVSHNVPNVWVERASYTYVDSPTTKYAPRYFDVSGRTLFIRGLLISKSSSDVRLKKEIKPLRDISTIYMSMEPVEYLWNEGYITSQKGLQFGLIAQDLENKLYSHGIINSGLVLKENAEEDEKAIHGDTITYKIDKENLHAMHIQMIQQLWNKVDKQEKEIRELKEKIDNKQC